VGEVTITDLSLAEARLAGARALVAQVEADLAASRAAFSEVTGLAPEGLAPATPPVDLPLSLDDAMAQAQTDHPAVDRAREGERAARARVGIERSTLLPRIAVVAQANRQEEPNTPGETVEGQSAVAQFSMPLFEGGYGWSRGRQGRIDVRRAEADTETVERQVMANVIERWSLLQSSRQVRIAAAQQAAANDAAVRGAERELGLGLRSTLDVLNTREDWQDSLVALARAEADEVRAAYALLAATGRLSFDTLGMPAVQP
jgi:outer membrane protein TolC